MKKIIALLLSMITAFGLFACAESTLGESSDFESLEISSDGEAVSDPESELPICSESVIDSEESNDSKDEENDVVNVLLVERRLGEGEALGGLLETTGYEIERKSVQDEAFPSSLAEICQYDEVILNNIAHKDMPDGFDELLEIYAREYGGGVLTVGGTDENGEQNAYVRDDMYGTVYQQMLPVDAIKDYTPPKGIVWILDDSGSMTATNASAERPFDLAKDGVLSGLDALSSRDYVGVMTLGETRVELPLTPCTQEDTIRSAIESVEEVGGGTVFSEAVYRAGSMLNALREVEKRHVILVTDGYLADAEETAAVVDNLRKQKGITFSVVLIGVDESVSAYTAVRALVEKGGGRLYTVESKTDIQTAMRREFQIPEFSEYEIQPFNPKVVDTLSPIVSDIAETTLSVQLGGFYATEAKATAEVILVGEYDVPIYAQWGYGEGKVGSFMCDLGGEWSTEFINSDVGKKILYNIVSYLHS